MRNIVVEQLNQDPIEHQKTEIVERKGLGHPDYICDSIMNQISVNLSKEYMKRVGMIVHHNIDKALLSAGEVENRFGGGIVRRPMLLVIGDRATFTVGNVDIPVREIAIETARKWFKENLRFVDPYKHVRYQIELKKGSQALTDIFERKGKVLGANDTSAAVGYAPMTRTEKIVLKTENFLNSKNFKKNFPESGEDVKVMGLRMGNDLHLTIAMAFIDKFIDSEETYFRSKNEVLEEVKNFLESNSDFKNHVYINTLDQKGRGINGMYLTVLGTCADGADCGQVGRGNKVSGVIPLNRPTSSEAAAGKNAVSHVGKIYNVLSYQLAEEIYQKISGIKEVYIWLLSQIGQRIDYPEVASAQLILEEGTSLNSISEQVKNVIDSRLEKINEFCMDLAMGKIEVC